MSSVQPPIEYLLTSSKTSLESFELSRLNQVANLRKEFRGLLDEWIEAEIEARLAHWFLDCRRAQDADPHSLASELTESILDEALDTAPPSSTETSLPAPNDSFSVEDRRDQLDFGPQLALPSLGSRASLPSSEIPAVEINAHSSETSIPHCRSKKHEIALAALHLLEHLSLRCANVAARYTTDPPARSHRNAPRKMPPKVVASATSPHAMPQLEALQPSLFSIDTVLQLPREPLQDDCAASAPTCSMRALSFRSEPVEPHGIAPSKVPQALPSSCALQLSFDSFDDDSQISSGPPLDRCVAPVPQLSLHIPSSHAQPAELHCIALARASQGSPSSRAFQLSFDSFENDSQISPGRLLDGCISPFAKLSFRSHHSHVHCDKKYLLHSSPGETALHTAGPVRAPILPIRRYA